MQYRENLVVDLSEALRLMINIDRNNTETGVPMKPETLLDNLSKKVDMELSFLEKQEILKRNNNI